MAKRDTVLGGPGEQPRKGFFSRAMSSETPAEEEADEDFPTPSFDTIYPNDDYADEDVRSAEVLLDPLTTPKMLLGSAALKYAQSESADSWEGAIAQATQAAVLLKFAEIKLLMANQQPVLPTTDVPFDA